MNLYYRLQSQLPLVTLIFFFFSACQIAFFFFFFWLRVQKFHTAIARIEDFDPVFPCGGQMTSQISPPSCLVFEMVHPKGVSPDLKWLFFSDLFLSAKSETAETPLGAFKDRHPGCH